MIITITSMIKLPKQHILQWSEHNSINTTMKTTVILSCLFAAALGSVLEPPALRELRRNPLFPDGRIVGGVDTDITKLPHQVALEYNGQHFCGGSIISNNYILTAAHCIIAGASQISVRVGTSSRNSGGYVYKVAEIAKNSKYAPKTLDYDVAVLKLERELQFSDKVKAIALVDSEPTESSSFVVSGWGMTQEDGQCSPTLKSVTIPIYSRSKCSQVYISFNIRITNRMICAYTVGKDSCQGDSGGPAVVNGKLGGIVSWGVGCARPNYPGVYTNIADSEIRSFIRSNANV